MFSISAIEVGVIEFDQFFKFGFDLVLAGIGGEAQSFARAGLPFKDARGGSAARTRPLPWGSFCWRSLRKKSK